MQDFCDRRLSCTWQASEPENYWRLYIPASELATVKIHTRAPFDTNEQVSFSGMQTPHRLGTHYSIQSATYA